MINIPDGTAQGLITLLDLNYECLLYFRNFLLNFFDCGQRIETADTGVLLCCVKIAFVSKNKQETSLA